MGDESGNWEQDRRVSKWVEFPPAPYKSIYQPVYVSGVIWVKIEPSHMGVVHQSYPFLIIFITVKQKMSCRFHNRQAILAEGVITKIVGI